MLFSRLWFLTAILAVFKVVLSEDFVPPSSWENIEFKKSLELTTSYSAETFEIRLTNIDTAPAAQYFIALPEGWTEKVSMFTAALQSREEEFVQCMLVPGTHELPDGTKISYGAIQFTTPVQPGESIGVLAKIFYNVAGTPFPEEISMEDEQTLLVSINRYPVSPYFTRSGQISISGAAEFVELNPSNVEAELGIFISGQFKYGTYEDIAPFTISPVKLVYPIDYPLTTVVNLKRDIWISHWAHTAEFQEYYELVNRGAKLNKGFTRFDFMKKVQKSEGKGGNFIGVLGLACTENSTDFYVTDKVGKVTSVKNEEGGIMLKPRYPIFGGWGYNFTIGWMNTLDDFLTTSGTDQDAYIISVPVLNGPADTIYESAEISIILPEGAKVLDVGSPVPFSNATVSREYSYFDLNDGHAKLTFFMNNLVTDLGSGELLVKYTLSQEALLKKPLYIAIYVFGALMGFFVLKNINLNVK